LTFLLSLLLVQQTYSACTADPADLRPMLGSSETVVYGTATSTSKLEILEVFKSSHSTTFDFVQLSLRFDRGAHPLASKSKGAYFGTVSGFESVMNVTCALTLSDCLLDSLRYNQWDLCPEVPPTHDTSCDTPHGHYPTGDSFVDPDTQDDCTCIDGSVACKPACTCTDSKMNLHHIGEVWWSSCQHCSCQNTAGICAEVCENDICTAIPLGTLASVFILATIFFAAHRARKATRDATLDTELGIVRTTRPVQQQVQQPVVQGYAQVPTQSLIMMSQQGQPVVVQVAYI